MTQPIAAEERLIVALDVADAESARALVRTLGDAVRFYKLGLELLMSGAYFALIDELKAQRKRIFVDLKFFDIPATVAAAVRNLSRLGVDFATVHGQDGMLAAAAQEKGSTQILAVTALTSLDRGDLDRLGFACDIEALVLSRAHAAFAAGCDGVVASGLELPALRHSAPRELIVVCPGIRPVDNDQADDQRRVLSPRAAITAGADYLVVGRPIRNAADPAAQATAIIDEIRGALGVRVD